MLPLIPIVTAIGARAAAGAAARAVATNLAARGASQATTNLAADLAGRTAQQATIATGNYAHERLQQRQQERRTRYV